eukprot:514228-Hanusia_phi.AAC.1
MTTCCLIPFYDKQGKAGGGGGGQFEFSRSCSLLSLRVSSHSVVRWSVVRGRSDGMIQVVPPSPPPPPPLPRSLAPPTASARPSPQAAAPLVKDKTVKAGQGDIIFLSFLNFKQ